MTPDQINEFFSFLYEGRLGQVTWWLQLLAGMLSSAFLAAIVVIAVKLREVTAGARQPSLPSLPPERVSGPWAEVLARLESPSPADWNVALVRADAIFDGVLKTMRLPGQTLGERLGHLDRSKLAALDQVWEAHKLRNRIVHETDRVLTHEEARRAIEGYQAALRELQYLE